MGGFWSDPCIQLVLLSSGTLFCSHGLQLFLGRRGFLYFGVGASALSLVFGEPSVTFGWRSIHASLHKTKEGWLSVTRPIAFPDVGPVAVDFVMEGVVNGNFVVAVTVDGVGQELKANAMACAVVSARVCPRSCDKKVGMYSLMQQRVDSVGAWAVLQQGRAQLEANACVLSALRVFGQLADAGAL